MIESQSHDRFNDAVAAHLPIAMEAQDALAAVADLGAAYTADIEQARLVIAGIPLWVTLLGTVAKESNTWLWAWANPGFRPDLAAIAPTAGLRAVGESWQLWELASEGFSLAGIADTGLGAGSSVALVAAPLVGATAMYAADYGAGVAYFGIRRESVPRPATSPAQLERFLRRAADVFPGHARAQILTYAQVHDLRVLGQGSALQIHFPSGQSVTVDVDGAGRATAFRPAGQP
ncbi:MAG: DUF6882 domain-containing protein [Micropruina sp.]|nr:hypothetical protein [Micropruina sp.]